MEKEDNNKKEQVNPAGDKMDENKTGKLESKIRDKQEIKEKKEPKKQLPKKEETFARALALHVSKKHCMYISNFIKNKKIDQAILDLEKVTKYKQAISFKGEIPHRKDMGLMSGRYPIKASFIFIKILKGLRGNALVNGMDLENTKIVSSSANWASRPVRSKGRRGKRTNIIIKAMEAEE